MAGASRFSKCGAHQLGAILAGLRPMLAEFMPESSGDAMGELRTFTSFLSPLFFSLGLV